MRCDGPATFSRRNRRKIGAGMRCGTTNRDADETRATRFGGRSVRSERNKTGSHEIRMELRHCTANGDDRSMHSGGLAKLDDGQLAMTIHVSDDEPERANDSRRWRRV